MLSLPIPLEEIPTTRSDIPRRFGPPNFFSDALQELSRQCRDGIVIMVVFAPGELQLQTNLKLSLCNNMGLVIV